MATAFFILYVPRDYIRTTIISGTFALATVLWLLNVYVFQDRGDDPHSTLKDYEVIIERIRGMGKDLTDLNRFLEKEQARVLNTEATIRKLSEEQSKLEPLVQTQKEVIEAILAAHSTRTAKNAWKERLLGFTLGLLASLVAATIHEYLKR
jgi:chromosome segregation ATPase